MIGRGKLMKTTTSASRRAAVNRVVEILSGVFYGNYFYGFCAVAQVIETSVQLRLPWWNVWLLSTVFVATVLFYNYPYARRGLRKSDNPRTEWYRKHSRMIRAGQVFFTIWLAASGVWFGAKHYATLREMAAWEWGLLLVFPAVSALYYGGNVLSRRINLRRAGWLKPFVIGFSWAGVVVVYPILFSRIQYGQITLLTWLPVLLFLKTFMFISVLAILFDIKDNVADSGSGLGTWVVRLGLSRTLFYFTLPLTALGVLTFLSYAVMHEFSPIRMLLILVPFLLLMLAIYSLKKQRSLLYYLVVIDGLMLVKAAFGIAAMGF